MRNLKKFLALVLAMVMALSLMLTVNASSFKDDDKISDTYAEAVDFLTKLAVIKGDDKGNFNPTDPIRRSEVAAMIYRAAGVSETQVGIYKDYKYFNDVDADDWFAGYVNYCGNAQYIKGRDTGAFDPWSNVTGYEVLAMILRVVGYDQNGEFEGTGWHIRTASTARDLGILKNIAEGTLGAPATRERVAEMIFQALQVPTVSYNLLRNYYPNNVLIADNDTNRANYKNAIADGLVLPLNGTLLYRNWGIVGKGNGLIHDSYGRPSTFWFADNSLDSMVESAAGNGDATKYVVSEDDDFFPIIPIKPVKTYYTAVTECQLSKDVNNDKTLTGVSEWVNGGRVKYGDDASNDPILTCSLDKLHTTTDVIGAQGRTTEVYKVSGGWNIIYIDTLLGEVQSVTPRTYDTNGHVYHKAKMEVLVNDEVTVVFTSESTDYTDYKKDDLVLLTTYGFNDDEAAASGGTGADDYTLAYIDANANRNGGNAVIQAAIPNSDPDKDATVDTNGVNDFKLDVWEDADKDGSYALTQNKTWAVDLVGKPEKVTITVKGTTGNATAKTGLMGEDGVTYPASNVYCAAADQETSVPGDYVPADYGVKMVNNLIHRTFDLYLDAKGNITGMQENAAKGNIGVITELEPVRIGTGRYAMEMEIFHVDGTTDTLKFLTWDDTAGKFTTVTSTATYLEYKYNTSHAVKWNRLIKYEPVTLNGETYYGVTEVATPEEDNTTATTTDVMVRTGLADTLRGNTTYTTDVLDDETQFIMASTAFDYSASTDKNEGKQVLSGLKGYTGFKTIPTIVGQTGDVMIQCLDDVYYVYPETDENDRTIDATAYGFTAKPAIAVDKSYLVLSTVATYADHAEYLALRNGEIVTLNVANINDTNTGKGLNELVEAARDNYEIITVKSEDLNGFATAIEGVNDANLGGCDNGSGAWTSFQFANTWHKQSVLDNTRRAANVATTSGATAINVVYRDGVLTVGNSASGTPDIYLTLADTCKVQIVNVATGNVYDGTLDNINQYRTAASGANISELAYEVDSNGYICNLYIID